MYAVLDVGVAVQAECCRFRFKQAWVVAAVRAVARQAQAGVDRVRRLDTVLHCRSLTLLLFEQCGGVHSGVLLP